MLTKITNIFRNIQAYTLSSFGTRSGHVDRLVDENQLFSKILKLASGLSYVALFGYFEYSYSIVIVGFSHSVFIKVLYPGAFL